jgi:hypothetical protein
MIMAPNKVYGYHLEVWHLKHIPGTQMDDIVIDLMCKLIRNQRKFLLEPFC